jgi:hypothetical protein
MPAGIPSLSPIVLKRSLIYTRELAATPPLGGRK